MTFDVGAYGGFIGALVNQVASDLEIQYHVSLVQFCPCTSDTFSLPK